VPLAVEINEVNEQGVPKQRSLTFDQDEGPRADTTPEVLAKLRAVFHAKGTVTAGNSSQTSDGAAGVVIMSRERANELGCRPLARFVSYAVGGVPPEIMGMGPIVAVPKALKLAGLTLDQIDLIELNEAFACQAIAVMRELGMDEERTNVNGGAVALGHPLGASGAKLTVQLLGEMRRRKSRYGMVTMCVGGGQGAATILENLQN
jgi:acetyl-CoA acyltransferase